jgi:ribosome recycling factor
MNMIDDILLESEDKMVKSIDSLRDRLTNIRAGRANPAMLDGVRVEYYGAETPLNNIANISVPEARKLQIKPFDKNALSDIEKAIYEADLGFTPNNNGECIFITIPELTEDRRKEFVKQAKKLGEEAKIALRNIRQDANNDIKRLELNEDEEKYGQNEVQELINKYNKQVDDIIDEKEKELLTI